MPVDVIYKVFVSSTFEDLREERSEVQKALLRARCFPIGMELFPSTDEDTWEFIKRQIADSDYYLVVIAGRYGSTDAGGTSFTEKEYNYAREIGKPLLAFVHADRSRIEARKTELDGDGQKRLAAFIAKVRARPLVAAYETPHELGLQVLASITELKERNPAVGFVRADQAADYKKYAALLEENASLRSQIAASARNSGGPFRGAFEKIEISLRLLRPQHEPEVRKFAISWAAIFLLVADRIIGGTAMNSSMKDRLPRYIAGTAVERERWDWFEKEGFELIKRMLFRRGLVRFERYHTDDSVSTDWQLTEEGRRQYGFLKDMFEGPNEMHSADLKLESASS